MLAAALEVEVNSYIAELADPARREWAPPGGPQRLSPAQEVTTAAGVIEVKAPRINDKRINEATGERDLFATD